MEYITGKKQKVVVAMSGGVDSSVAAALLVEQGYDVSGMFMKNWSPLDEQSLSDCPWMQDQKDAASVCEKLGIEFRSVNFEKEYKERVVNYFISEYAAGRTPNPDVMCNKEIKFKSFLEEAEKMGAELIATGHYAQIKSEDGTLGLYRGVDPSKDQSYFLWGMNQHALEKTLLPVGGLTKVEVRALAHKYGLPTASKKDSQGICFIGHIDLKQFLAQHISAHEGQTKIIRVNDGMMDAKMRVAGSVDIGKHSGSMYYTIGEKAGPLIDNGLYKKWAISNGFDGEIPHTYIVGKDPRENVIYVTNDASDPLFYSNLIELEGFYFTGNEDWHDILGLNNLTDLTCQIRYQQNDKVIVESIEMLNGALSVTTKQPSRAIAAGQSLVLYQNERVVGAGIIGQEIISQILNDKV